MQVRADEMRRRRRGHEIAWESECGFDEVSEGWKMRDLGVVVLGRFHCSADALETCVFNLGLAMVLLLRLGLPVAARDDMRRGSQTALAIPS